MRNVGGSHSARKHRCTPCCKIRARGPWRLLKGLFWTSGASKRTTTETAEADGPSWKLEEGLGFLFFLFEASFHSSRRSTAPLCRRCSGTTSTRWAPFLMSSVVIRLWEIFITWTTVPPPPARALCNAFPVFCNTFHSFYISFYFLLLRDKQNEPRRNTF